MSSKELLDAVLALPLDERASLAREIIASLDGAPDPELLGEVWGILDIDASRTQLSLYMLSSVAPSTTQ